MPNVTGPPTMGSARGARELRGFNRLWRVLKQIFYEAIGALFGILAFAWLNSAFRAWTRDVAHWLIALSVAVALLFVFFAVSSFRRARSL
jgi:VIT1/CCC1 family predicted Fe2+/Mn2+ transporter